MAGSGLIYTWANATYPVAIPYPFCDLGLRTSIKDKYVTPTTCFEAKDPTPKENLRVSTLFAEGMLKVSNQVYPEEIYKHLDTLIIYDEPLYPVPVGTSVFYTIMCAWITTFYFTYLGRKLLGNVKQKMDLYPEAHRFPSLPLYWIQQSKREAELRREVRNTWAWLARRYLLSPNDPLLANVDQVLGLVNWHDFEVSRTTWSLIKVILTVNALYVKVKRNRKEGQKQFEIIKDVNLAKRESMQDDPIQVTRVFLEDVDDRGGKPKATKTAVLETPAEKTKKTSDDNPDLRALDSWLQTTASTTGPKSILASKPKQEGGKGKGKGKSGSASKAPGKKSGKSRKAKSVQLGGVTSSVLVDNDESEMDASTVPATQVESETGTDDYTTATSATTTTGSTDDEDDDGRSTRYHLRKKKRRRRRKKKHPEGERRWNYFFHS